MINIQIPKDIREYEPKFVANLTFRQTICLVAAAAIEIGGVQFEKVILGLPSASFIPPLIFAIFPILFGWGKPVFHMETETFLRRVFLPRLVYPSRRVYQTRNYYDVYLTEPKKEGETGKKKKKGKMAKNEEEGVPEEYRAYE